ncbi:MAG: AAA family ATPase [Myxococcales bacterium]|nr:AAA family ATPase [Myxococcales bacterium]MDH3483871.1 AAA family ATPase [Myxococcales bacterium]
MSRPEVIVCSGGGGVGKTTVSAALALALAKNGYRALIVSIDPARRLADAMGVELGTKARELSLDAGRGQLFALMPDPHNALRTFIEMLFEEEPASVERLLKNRLYLALEAAVPGIHEVVAMSLTWRAIVDYDIDVVVIDTAPSRNAVDFIGYPKRLAKLLGGRAVGWMAAIGKRTSISPEDDRMGRVEGLLVRALGPVARDVAGLFSEMARVRERFIMLNEHTSELLLHPDTRYFLVASLTVAARDDVHYLFRKLSALELVPRALIINSEFVPKRNWIDVLENSDEMTTAIREVIAALDEEDTIRKRAAQRTTAVFSRRYPNVLQLSLPFIEVVEPRNIVHALSDYFDIPALLAR